MKEIMNLLAGVVFVVAFIPYVYAILRKKAQPQKSTWIIWATLDWITFFGMKSKGTLNGQMWGCVIGASAVALLALKFGKPGWKKLDVFCLGVAVLGVTLWQMFNSPTIGLVACLSVVFIGSFPTFKEAWNDPDSEDKLAWVLYWVSCVFALIAIKHWNVPAESVQPITFFVIETIMVCILFLHRSPSPNKAQ